ncbi:hypothetical protein FBZ94_109173 [Bradyrhizobium sacchari]|uniref:Uncharacterized protein n=1 Tax=Bradyrhizobium sacchari TaxID=1399419 RepID=A0A560I3C8_9BRAD|nr:hypothetical protein FBZ94_109173 [Bradyrhizobium sacchari]TWB70191.1 hypothetical protein FBZ95_108190 [Bradyrhizobium sacchari]
MPQNRRRPDDKQSGETTEVGISIRSFATRGRLVLTLATITFFATGTAQRRNGSASGC